MDSAAVPAATPPAQSRPAPVTLPPPSSLLARFTAPQRAKSANYVPADLLRQAESFDAALPHQRVAATATGATFSPDWSGSGSGFSDLSFAVYSFQVPGYQGSPTLAYGWNTPPSAPDSVYIGLANWQSDSWDWLQGDSSSQVEAASISPYVVFNGGVLVCVLRTGTDASELDWLRLGSAAPQPAVSATPESGLTPLSVDFDASGSIDSDSAIVEYRWDPQGDGSFDISTGTDPHYTFEYASAGNYPAAVRVVDDSGIYADTSVAVAALDNVSFSFGTADAAESGAAVFGLSNGELLVFVNHFVQDPTGWQILQARFSLTGETSFVNAWTDGGRVDLFDAVADAEGNFYVCGQNTANGSYDGLLQKWSQNGELLWSKAVGSSTDAEVFNSLCLSEDSIYVCGYWYSYDLLRHFGILLRFDLSGNKVWDYSAIAPMDCMLKDIAFHSSEQPGTPSLYVCGEFNPSYSDTDAFYATFDTDGNLYSAKRWGGGGSSRETAAAISVRGELSPAAYVAGSIVNPGTRTYMAQPGAATIVLSSGTNEYLEAADLLDLTVLARRSGAGIPQGMALATFDSSLNLLGQREFNTVSGSYYSADLAPYGASSFVITGMQYGGLPAEAPLTLSTETSALAWTDAAVPIGNPTFTALDTPTALIAHPGFELNRESNDGDAFIFLKKW